MLRMICLTACLAAIVAASACDPRNVWQGNTPSQTDDTTDAGNQPDTSEPRPDVGPPPFVCSSEKDCSDGDPCTNDSCLNGQCLHKAKACAPGFVCNEVGECAAPQKSCDDSELNDGNPCTIDTCDYLTGEAVHTPKSCDDGNDVTEDYCDPARPKGQECIYIAQCWDSDPCTVDSFDTDMGACEYTSRCGAGKYCNPETGECWDGCEVDSDCNDDNVCTLDRCVGESAGELGYCDNSLPVCAPDEVCHAGKPEGEQCLDASASCSGPAPQYDASCSELICLGGDWVLIPIVYCQNGACQNGTCVVTECEADADCADNPCATGTCQSGACEYSFDICPTGQVCDATSGTCFTPSEDVCGDKDCDDGDDATLDYCDPVTGECEHHQPIVCAEGTKLVEETGECVPVAAGICMLGELTCLTIGDQTHLAECVETEDEDNPTEWQSYFFCGQATEWGCVDSDPPQCINFGG